MKCIARAILQSFLEEKLSKAENSQIGRHVSTCADCQRTLEELSDPNGIVHHLAGNRSVGVPLQERSDAVVSESAPLRFGRFRIVARLGRGGMGEVHKAWDEQLQRFVAIKILGTGRCDDQSQQRFQREAQAAASVHHENIVRVHDVEGDPKDPYLVMEFIEGKSLSEIVRSGPLEPIQAARICGEIAQGLAGVHNQDLVHRDVKPSNVILRKGDERPVLVDFGIARSASLTTHLTTNEAPGTADYMSPEQGVRPHTVDHRSDIYSLGITLFECCTGTVPFPGPAWLVLRHHQEREPDRPSRLNSKVPRDLETIILKCLQKEPEFRYQTAQQLADDLGRFLRDEPISARPVSSAERFYRWGRRNPVVTISLTTAILTVAVSFPLVTWKWIETQRQRDSARRESERANRNLAWARRAVDENFVKFLQHPHFRHTDQFRDLHLDLLASAVAFYEDVARQDGQDDTVLADRGKAHWRLAVVRYSVDDKLAALADVEQMQSIFGKLATDFPENIEYRFFWGWSFGWQTRLLHDLNRPKESEGACTRAINILEAVLREDPQHTNAVFKLGACYLYRAVLFSERGDLDQAIDWYDRAIRRLVEPIEVRDMDLLGNREFFLTKAYNEKSVVLICSQRWQEAIESLGRLRAVDQTNPVRWYDLAIAHLANGDYEGYRQVCGDLVKAFPECDPHTAARISYACLPLHNAIENVGYLKTLAGMARTTGAGNARLVAAAFYRNGEFGDAVRTFTDAKEHYPERNYSGWDWFFLAMASHKIGQEEEGRRCFNNGKRWLNERMRKDPEAKSDWGWTEQVEVQLLHKEAAKTLAD